MLAKIKSFFENRRIARIERSAKIVRNPKALREDRWAALEFLRDLTQYPERTIPILLSRFEYSLEHGIQDTREKEVALDGIVKHKAAAVPLLNQHLKTTLKIAWPIKALKLTTDEATLADSLIGCLNYGDIALEPEIVEKNYDVLCYLRDFKLGGYAAKLAHFLSDQDERVRFASCELILEIKDPETPALLEKLLIDESAENRRLAQAIQKAFAEQQWPIRDPAVIEYLKTKFTPEN